jgi:hypothetical protein
VAVDEPDPECGNVCRSLRTEDGGKILSKIIRALILDDHRAATVNYQAGGAGHPGRKRLRRSGELFRKQADSEALGLVPPVVAGPAGQRKRVVKTLVFSGHERGNSS